MAMLYMGALWFHWSNDRFMGMDEGMRRVIVDGFSALQQATFASPKRKSIAAYEEFCRPVAVTFMCQLLKKKPCSAKPLRLYSTGFKENIREGETFYQALVDAAATAEEKIDGGAMMDVK